MGNNLATFLLILSILLILKVWTLSRFFQIATERDEAQATLKLLQIEISLLQHRTLHDYLTGLPNRILLEDRIRQAVVKATRDHSHFLILFLDLDGFKPVNDKYGHDVGDRLLIEVGHRIRSTIREEDTIARIGGDEFVLLACIATTSDASVVIKKITDALKHPFHVKNHQIYMAASTGKSIFPEDGNTLEQLLLTADQAMYAVKNKNRTQQRSSATKVG